MSDKSKLILIKSLHSIIWLIMASASFYILYSGITNTTSILLWISIGLLGIETLILLFNKWTCPLTPIARKYTTNRQPDFDIYLPKVIAKHNKQIFGTIFVIGLILVIINLLS